MVALRKAVAFLNIYAVLILVDGESGSVNKTFYLIYANCHYAECRYAEFHCTEFRYTECCYAECHSAEIRLWQVSKLLVITFRINFFHFINFSGYIFSHVRPFYEQAVRDQDQKISMHRPV